MRQDKRELCDMWHILQQFTLRLRNILNVFAMHLYLDLHEILHRAIEGISCGGFYIHT